MSWALAALQVVLAGTFFLSATGKLLSSDEFAAALRLSHLPEALIALIAIAVPVFEIVIGLWLVLASPTTLPIALVATACLLLVFTLWMGSVQARRLHVRCGCFGPNGGQVGLATIGRNLVLIALAAVGWATAVTVTSVLPGPSLWLALAATGFALGIALLSALRFAWPHLVVTEDQLRPGGAAGE